MSEIVESHHWSAEKVHFVQIVAKIPQLWIFLQEIDYDSFRRFLDAFLDYETPEDLSKHLFISFLSPQITQLEQQGKIFNQMAALSTNAACAPVTSHSRGEHTS